MHISVSKDPVIRIRGLVNAFDGAVVHDQLDLDVYPGEIIGVVGGSGTGKSVLMRSIIGLQRQRAGTIELFGQDVGTLKEMERRHLQRRFGVLFQDGALFSSMTVLQNIQVPLREHLDISDALSAEIATLKLAMAGLEKSAGEKFPSELSGGMRKRAGLARALVLDPDIVFLDEPTAGLDPIGAAKFDDLIVDLKESLGLTVFMITHDLDSLYRACDRIAVLSDKKVIIVGTLDTVSKMEHPWIKEYFTGPRGRAARFAEESKEQKRSPKDRNKET